MSVIAGPTYSLVKTPGMLVTASNPSTLHLPSPPLPPAWSPTPPVPPEADKLAAPSVAFFDCKIIDPPDPPPPPPPPGPPVTPSPPLPPVAFTSPVAETVIVPSAYTSRAPPPPAPPPPGLGEPPVSELHPPPPLPPAISTF